MGFVLLRRDDGEVTLITPRIFATRREALDEVTRASADGHLAADEVVLVDLDASTPVLIVTPPPAQEEAVPEHDEDSAEPEAGTAAALIETAASAPLPPTIDVEDAIAEAIIADAEERDLEIAEAQAPPVGPVNVPSDDADETAEAEEQAAPAAVEEVFEPLDEPGVPTTPVVTADEEPAARTWPWEPAPVPLESPGSSVESVADVTDESEQEASTPPIADGDTPADEPADEMSGLLADLEEIGAEAPTQESAEERAESPAEPAVAASDAIPEVSAEPESSKAYEAGASDITTLTCDDCIYLNTCPKKGESDPTSCGSFQWKSV
ncbi:MAG: hypothetical protein RQ731_01580 [Anaerosomatales bacterium]|nr:hypothetical protein [Anaerosomatales bacterium]MDT8433443.1 hypothetical protein [Anaerosomatales bacterium]